MKLNSLPLLAGLLFYSVSYSQNPSESEIDFSKAFEDDSTQHLLKDEKTTTLSNPETAVADESWLQKNTKQANGDSIEIIFQNKFGGSNKIKFWWPNQETLKSIIDYVKTINLYEDKNGDNSEYAKKERKDFLKKLEFCFENKTSFLNNLAQAPVFGTKLKNGKTVFLGEAWTYNHLKQLSDMAATNNLLVVQDYLVLNCWLMNEHHTDGNYKPIISEEEYERIAMQNGQR